VFLVVGRLMVVMCSFECMGSSCESLKSNRLGIGEMNMVCVFCFGSGWMNWPASNELDTCPYCDGVKSDE